MKKKNQLLKETDSRKVYNIVYQHLINDGMCLICSRRFGEWTNCWGPDDKEYDNPVKSWKYTHHIKKQWMKNLL